LENISILKGLTNKSTLVAWGIQMLRKCLNSCNGLDLQDRLIHPCNLVSRQCHRLNSPAKKCEHCFESL